MKPQRLFQDIDLHSFLEERKARMEKEIDAFDRDRILSASIADLTSYFHERYCIDPVHLNKDEMTLDPQPQEVMVDERTVPNPAYGEPRLTLRGFRYVLRIPFEGYDEVFKLRPSRYTTPPPAGNLEGGGLVLTLDRRVDVAPERVNVEFMQAVAEIEEHLGTARADILAWLPTLRQSAWERVEARKRDLLKAEETASKTGFKLRERPDVPEIHSVPTVRRKVRPPPVVQLPGSVAGYKPEPDRLLDADYDHIISLISSMATVLERSPHAFVHMDEESLRFVLLVPLNSHYEGEASGEAFNFDGKTDILIRVKDKTIFVAECKIWRGRKELLAAIDQLLGYATWRDTKTAIIIFNRNKDFSAVLSRIRPAVESHPKFKRFQRHDSETIFRFVFKQRDDDARELALTVLVFNVPVPAEPAKS